MSHGATLPIFGFVIPLLIAILLIVESFQHSWQKHLALINTLFAIALFICAIMVLLTKEIYLSENKLGDTALIRNGSGPIFSAVCSTLGACVLLFTTYFPLKGDIKFIEK